MIFIFHYIWRKCVRKCRRLGGLVSMAKYKKDVTPLLTHWSYVFLTLTHRCVPTPLCWITGSFMLYHKARNTAPLCRNRAINSPSSVGILYRSLVAAAEPFSPRLFSWLWWLYSGHGSGPCHVGSWIPDRDIYHAVERRSPGNASQWCQA